MKRYNPKEIEPKWQKIWEDKKIHQAADDSSKPKKYILEYFPYPSGAAMHVGHVRNYTIGDAITRYNRMNGFNVLHPMGWDSFGLPAENYAIKNNVSPRQAIDDNTARFKAQLMQMGFGYDWSREIDSSDPGYYKWTQWFFLLLHKRGLAYQKQSAQWWCPVDKTVLANEQVEAGVCWRCGSQVEKKMLKQWFFKITEYADRLEKDLDNVDWSHAIKTMQRNWIGRSKGAEINFAIYGGDSNIKVFTTRPDTLFGATFLVLAPEHPLVQKLAVASHKSSVANYVKQAASKSEVERMETEREKTGVPTGAYAINPANGQKIPIWIADYVLPGYGTGAIMAVPAHDERDYEFAQKFNLPITQVVQPIAVDTDNPPREGSKNTTRNVAQCVVINPKDGKFLTLKWNKYDWQTFITGGVEEGENLIPAAKREITEETGYKNLKFIKALPFTINSHFYAAHKQVNCDITQNVLMFELEDEEKIDQKLEAHEDFEIVWVEKRELEKLGPMTELDSILKWLEEGDYIYSGEGRVINSGKYDGLGSAEARDAITADIGQEKINYKIRDWLISRQRYWGAPIPIIHCPEHGAVPVPEDQLPVVLPEVQSYQPTGEVSVLASAADWVNTTCPQCGGSAKRETDTMDGFACSSWYFLRFADPHNDQKPFDANKAKYWLPVDDYIGGAEHAVMHLLYARFWTKVMYDEGLISFKEPFSKLRNQGMILAPDGQKMSKSKGNTIEPDELISQGYGADSIRLMELFIGPWNQAVSWSVEGIGGTFRFLQRVWTITQEYLVMQEADSGGKEGEQELKRIMHRTTKKVTQDLQDMSFNTAIAALMECVNDLYKLKASHKLCRKQPWSEALTTLTQLLAPFAPHIAEELWQDLGGKGSVHTSDWPGWDESLLVADTVKIAVQVNGKVRSEIVVNSNATEQEVIDVAQTDAKVAPHLSGKQLKKAIYVPGRLVSLVI